MPRIARLFVHVDLISSSLRLGETIATTASDGQSTILRSCSCQSPSIDSFFRSKPDFCSSLIAASAAGAMDRWLRRNCSCSYSSPGLDDGQRVDIANRRARFLQWRIVLRPDSQLEQFSGTDRRRMDSSVAPPADRRFNLNDVGPVQFEGRMAAASRRIGKGDAACHLFWALSRKAVDAPPGIELTRCAAHVAAGSLHGYAEGNRSKNHATPHKRKAKPDDPPGVRPPSVVTCGPTGSVRLPRYRSAPSAPGQRDPSAAGRSLVAQQFVASYHGHSKTLDCHRQARGPGLLEGHAANPSHHINATGRHSIWKTDRRSRDRLRSGQAVRRRSASMLA